MIIELKGVLADATAPPGTVDPLVPFEQEIRLPRAEQLRARIRVVGRNGTKINLTGMTVKLTVRRLLTDQTAMFTRVASLTTPADGICEVVVAEDDTAGLYEKKTYAYDVWLTDGAGLRWQLIPVSPFRIEPTAGREDDLVGPPVPDPGTPVAIGPRGFSVLVSDGPLPDDEGRDFDSNIATDHPDVPLFHKENAAWVFKANLRGPPGPAAILSDDDPLELGPASPGTSGENSRSDHVHPHGDQDGGSLHAIAVDGGAAGFMSGTMAQQLADLVAANFGGQIGGVAVDLQNLSTTVTALSASHSSLSATVAGIAANYVTTARTVGAGAGLTGGGSLASDIALAVGALDATIDVQADGIRVGVIADANLDDVLATPGDFTNVNISVNAKGRITAIASGSAGNLTAKYLIQQADGTLPNAQVLGDLVTGFAKVTNGTGVVSTQATIAGTDLSGFTDTRIPVANSSGQLVDSTLTLASNVLTHAAQGIGGNVGLVVSNTSDTASATATITIRVAGLSASAPRLTLGRTGGADWHVENRRATNDLFQIVKGSAVALSIDPAASFNQAQIKPNGTNGVSLGSWAATGDTRVGSSFFGLGFAANYYLNIGPDTAGSAGRGVAGIFYDGTAWRNAISWAHVSGVGNGALKLMENGGNVAVGGAASPASLDRGIVFANGTAPTGDPSNAFAMWSESAAAKFRGGDSSITTLGTYTASHVATRAGGAVSFLIENGSNAASSSAGLTLRIPGTSTGTPYIDFERTGGTSWRIENLTTGLGVTRASNASLLVAATFVQFQPSSTSGAQRNITVSWDAAGLPVTGPTLESRSTASGTYLNIFTYGANTTGGVAIAARDTSAANFKYAISVANRAGPPQLKLVEHGGVVLVGGAAAPASFEGGLVLRTGVAPSADPAAGEAAMYFDGTAWKSRIGSSTQTFQLA